MATGVPVGLMRNNHPPLNKQILRQFGLIFGAIFVIWIGLTMPWLFRYSWQAWPFVVGVLVALTALVAPLLLKPLYIGWAALGRILGWVNTRILLGLVFFLMMTPLGLLLRLMGKNPLHLRFDAVAGSYRCQSRKPPPDHMEHPY